MIYLKKANRGDLEKEWLFVREMPEDENGFTNSWHNVSREDFEKNALPTMLKFAEGTDLPEGYVPESFFFLWRDNEIVGQFRIRHYLCESMRTGAGHIGYFIASPFRGQGLGTEGLRLTLKEAHRIVPEEEIYLRVNLDNPASLHVMLNNGGSVVSRDDGHYYVRIPNPGKGRYPSVAEAKEILADAEQKPQAADAWTDITEKFVRRSAEILKKKLTGIYLHGSAAMGCYQPEKSDLDLMVIIEGELTEAEKREYMEMVIALDAEGPAKGIEMSMVARDVCDPFVYPTPFILHWSRMHAEWYRKDSDDYIRKMNGTDGDLAAHFTVIRNRGIRLYGLPVSEVFGEVPEQDYLDSIRDDVTGAAEQIADHPMYYILNLARVLGYLKEKEVMSKKEGGEWGLKNLPEKYRALLLAALDEYENGTEVQYEALPTRDYAGDMLGRINSGQICTTQEPMKEVKRALPGEEGTVAWSTRKA